MTLPTNHPYFFTCPSCGCKLISVSSGVRAKPHCPECDYFADDAFVVKSTVDCVVNLVRSTKGNTNLNDALEMLKVPADIRDAVAKQAKALLEA